MKEISVSSSRMTRQKLEVKGTLVRLWFGQTDRINALAGRKNQMAKFVREAVEGELERRGAEPPLHNVAEPKKRPRKPKP